VERSNVRRRAGIFVAAATGALREAARTFKRHGGRQLAAGLAFYTLFALVPTLFLALTIVAAIFGREATDGRLVDRLDDIVGADVAEQIEQAVAELWENTDTTGFALITTAVVVYSASKVFVAWRDTLGAVWELPIGTGLRSTVHRRVFGAAGPIAVGLLLAAIVLIEMLAALGSDLVTSPLIDALIGAVSWFSPMLASLAALGLLYRYSTRARPRWRDIWPGTVATAVALAVLAWGYGLYVRMIGSSSAAGAAGSVVLGMAFIYLAAQVLLFGAEIVGSSARRRGGPLGRAVGGTGGLAC
jgi:membrane protein